MTREEAIKVIKDNWPEGRVLLKLALEFLIPELKESEDENIRKSIIGFLKTIASLKDGKTVSNADFDSVALLEWAAWLEKQGEHQEYPKDVIDNAISFLANRNDGMPEEEAKDIVNAIITVLNPCYWPKRVEQKPAWSEEDKKMIDTIIYDLERHGGKEDSCYSAEINWLKSLKEK